jgi:hypothetical protein
MKKFKARLGTEEGKELFVQVPFDVKAQFGKARLPVRISVNGHAYRTTVSVYGGKYYLPVRKEHRQAAGVKVGDLVSVTMSPDTEARVVELPRDLASVLSKNKKAMAAWDKLAYSHKKEHVDAIAGAKRPETRARRVTWAVEMLEATAGAKKGKR